MSRLLYLFGTLTEHAMHLTKILVALIFATFSVAVYAQTGCTIESACNYDPIATENDGSCTWSIDCAGTCGGTFVIDDCENCFDPNEPAPDCFPGCTDPEGDNYDPEANYNDGSCTYDLGCTDEAACNFSALATIDDGTCEYIIDCQGTCGGTFIEDACGNCYDSNAQDGVLTFEFTGDVQTFEAPVTGEYTFETWGAQGGNITSLYPINGGLGGYAKGSMTLNQGDILYVYVGGKGQDRSGDHPYGGCALAEGGWNGGGATRTAGNGTPGGGASDIRLSGQSLSDRVIVAGGGGGGGWTFARGGNGGGLTGENGTGSNESGTGAQGGTQNAGGAQGNSGGSCGVTSGTFGIGGDASGSSAGGGGGGGGWYGGGGGGFADGGGGGSSYVDGLLDTEVLTGVREGNGQIIISYDGIPECIEGCTDELACNYDPAAQADDGSCILPDGCTDESACNYDIAATCDDGSCILPDGCTDGAACNYDPNAICDNGSCAYEIDCAGVCGGVFIEDLCGNCYDPNNLELTTQSFSFTGDVQTFTAPADGDYVFEAWGAQGGNITSLYPIDGGLGGYAKGTMSLMAGETLYLYVGGKGQDRSGDHPYGDCALAEGGWNGGGATRTAGNGTPGGGASDIRIGGQSLSDRVIVAGGGGGGGWTFARGGNGGGLTGENGTGSNESGTGAQGGTQNAGGAQGNSGGSCGVTSGTFGIGGDASGGSAGGGGGGGGWYGGGGGGFADGGGGGSSYVDGLLDTEVLAGVQTGNGQIAISYGVIPQCNEGCLDPLACNYVENADIDDGSCILPDGCTDETACNYDPAVTCDDGTCILPDGCTDEAACNYDPNAVCDDLSCQFVIDCAGVCGGTFIEDACGNCYDSNAQDGVITFEFTGDVQTFEAPVTGEYIFETWGAQGGNITSLYPINGGLGGYAKGSMTLNQGDILYVYVGGKGQDRSGDHPYGSCALAEGGWNGGGATRTAGNGTPGGGASDIRLSGQSLSDRVIVAGGGGGGGWTFARGGNGGGLTGENGTGSNESGTGAQGGTQNAGGAQGNSGGSCGVTSGTFGIGGDASGSSAGGGGGGGGWYGGGGGGFADGGGGGSSYVDGLLDTEVLTGVREGNGQIIISYDGIPECNAGCMDPSACNYDDTADVDDGSCILPDGCTDGTACNYDAAAQCDDGSCILPDGCTDAAACNYDPNATCDDGSCAFVIDCAGVCGGTFIEDLCGNCYDPNNLELTTQTFSFTGDVQTFTAPADGDYVFEAWGAQGGNITSLYPIDGGLGGYAKGTISLMAGETLHLYVGGKGQDRSGDHPYGDCALAEGGWNGGGATRTAGNGTPGGGASDIRIGGQSLSDRVIVAGGGGGGGWTFARGGNGGGLSGENGTGSNQSGTGAQGGTQNAGGAQGNSGGSCGVTSGTFGIGGDASGGSAGGGGGGGGWYGGGGGGFADGGGGGSSYVDGLLDTEVLAGVQTGNGQIAISYGVIPQCNEGCMDPVACNYDDTAEVDDGSCILPDGCTDATACNFDPDAQCNDGSCTYPGCLDEAACNYDMNAGCDNESCIYEIDCAGVCGGTFIEDACGNCYDGNAQEGSVTFSFTGDVQTFEAPVTGEYIFEAWGAQGGNITSLYPINGGLGGYAKGSMTLNQGDILYVYVGGKGQDRSGDHPYGSCALAEGGWNGGGATRTAGNGTPGGGASDIRLSGQSLSDRIIVAGGGGGGGWTYARGGNGGGLTGENGTGSNESGTGAQGGTQNAGGAQGNSGGSCGVTSGTFGIGGDASGSSAGGGGGGGGWYGGGGGGFADGGGGGSSYVDGLLDTEVMAGIREGNGQIMISYDGIPECNAGCMDPLACNYDDTAEVDDGSCILPDGCTDETACNYDAAAQCDDGSCILPDGCTDGAACNYDPNAICDDGSCAFVVDCAGMCGGTFVEDLCGNCYDPNNQALTTVTFNFTGDVQTFTAPVTGEYIFETWGAQGGNITSLYPIDGGLGGYAKGSMMLTAGDVLNVYVGGKGQDRSGDHPYGSCALAEGGWNGGGATRTAGNGTPGGGASDIRIGGQSLSDRVIVAGGGGGGGWTFARGGNGGGLTGENGTGSNESGTGAQGGTQNAGGTQGNSGGSCGVTSGTFGIGGDASGSSAGGGGGGGGWYGGGGGGFADGGGGGSSYVDGLLNTEVIAGVREGNGQIIIAYSAIPECNEGCMDPIACNYDENADVDDASCFYPDGCTDELACNYDAAALCDDGSCTYPGCNDNAACNFDPSAGCDDGSCIYEVDCAGTCGGTFIEDECGNCYDGNAQTGSMTFEFTGDVQTFEAPADGEYTVEAWGAQGGNITSLYPIDGGLGGYAKGTMTLNQGDILYVYVGGKGQDRSGDHPYGDCALAEGGWNGGGATRTAGNGSPGGGASDIRIGGQSLSDRVIVAGGGGGGGWTFARGGNGGDLVGENGTGSNESGTGAQGGTQNAGGAQGNSGGNCGVTSGTFGIGGDASGNSAGGGGGGGGWYGGGGGGFADGGGGGSSYVDGLLDTEVLAGVREGNGQIIITFDLIPECNPGCIDAEADNFNPDANFDDGSCIYLGCTDMGACNYDPEANSDDGSCIFEVDCNGICGGPSVTDDCGNCYDPTIAGESFVFNYTGFLQSFVVPDGVAEIYVEAYGAAGGSYNGGVGGLGTKVAGMLEVTPGEQIKLLIGNAGQPGDGQFNYAGGGGGTFVTDNSDNPLLIAGGGGGVSGAPTNGLMHATLNQNANDGYSPNNPTNFGVGGSSGNGASNSLTGEACGGNGAGLLTDGEEPLCSDGGNTSGQAFVNGGAGGTAACGAGITGGFGGGGGGGCHGAGGGGGYSGGGGSYGIGGNGGGGSSFNAALQQSNEAQANDGDGYVIITIQNTPFCVPGCTDQNADNFNPLATYDDGTCVTSGCMDDTAANYNPQATEDDGTCLYPGCTYADATNYDENANTDDGSCVFEIVVDIAGCMDQSAINYNPEATIDTGVCWYSGCMNALAVNYNANADYDDGSCIVEGCTDVTACNYLAEANSDDGSCHHGCYGCMYPNALNYDPDATLENGLCEFDLANPCPEDLNEDGLVNSSDLLQFLGSFGSACE